LCPFKMPCGVEDFITWENHVESTAERWNHVKILLLTERNDIVVTSQVLLTGI